MATDKNALLWAIRGIEDTDTLRVACEELERVLYSMAGSGEYAISKALHSASCDSIEALYAVVKALPEHNTDLESGVFIAD